MKYTTKPRKKVAYTFKAKKWFKLDYKEASFKDLNTQPHYTQGKWYNKGFTDNGGKSRKCRYAGLYN